MTAAIQRPTQEPVLPLHNREAVAQLAKEKEYLANAVKVFGLVAIAIAAALNAAGFLIFSVAYKPLVAVQKIARLEIVSTEVLDRFEHMGVQVFPTQRVADGTEKNPIDIFIRFPGKAHIILSIRSKGEAEIVFNESKETLYVKRKGKGMRLWQPCPLVELGDYATWLNKNRQIYGLSAKEVRNVPLAKVLVLWSPSKLDSHREHLYSKIGSIQLLALRRKGVAFVIHKEEICDFIQAYLDSYEAKQA